MSAEFILKSMPASTEWLVLFRLNKIREVADDGTVKAMFFLPDGLILDEYSFVILSSEGTMMLKNETTELYDVTHQRVYIGEFSESIFDEYQNDVTASSFQNPDCIGLGSRPPSEPVIVIMKIENGLVDAETFLISKPDFKNYELLKSIGVTFVGSEFVNGRSRVRFQNKLPSHIHSGILAHFKRTDNCNQFFFNHCNINEQLEKGLINSTLNKINHGREDAFNRVCEFAKSISDEVESLTCCPPAPAKEFRYGDIVPYGFVLAAISPKYNNDFLSHLPIRENVMKYLNEVSNAGLWSYDRKGIVTATDSAFVLLGYYKPQSVLALERFSDGNGGYYPQLFSDTVGEHQMKMDNSNSHWCKTDIGTTYLVAALRSNAELPETTGNEFYERTFEHRGSLFFANPYMTDYFLAMALSCRDNQVCKVLREKLKNEIICSMNEDYSFGKFDVPLSSAFAILALSELGFNNRVLSLCQLKLSGMLKDDTDNMIPFYSTLKIDKQKFSPMKITSMIFADGRKQIIERDGHYFAVSLYKDKPGIITTSVVSMALSVKSNPNINDIEILKEKSDDVKEIYTCENHKQYIEIVFMNYVKR